MGIFPRLATNAIADEATHFDSLRQPQTLRIGIER